MKNQIIKVILFFVVMLHSTVFAVKDYLVPDPRFPDYRIEVEIPFKYHSINALEKFQYVTAGSYEYLPPKSQLSFVLIGPLNPCFVVRFKNQQDGHVLVFHIAHYSSLESMATVVREHIAMEDPSKIDVAMYSVQNKDEEKEIAKKATGWTQKGRMLSIRNYIRDNLGIPSEQIRGRIQTKPELALERYSLLYCGYIIIDKSGEFFSTDPLVEDIFNFNSEEKLSKLSQVERINAFIKMDDILQLGELSRIKSDAKGERALFRSNPICLLEKASEGGGKDSAYPKKSTASLSTEKKE